MARRITVEIVGDASKLERAFRQASGAGSRFGSAMRTLGRVATVGVGGAFVGLAATLKVGFSEMAEGQKVAAQTGAVLKSTGGIANVTAKQVDRLANELSIMTGIDDEAVQANENLLLTFKNVRKEMGRGNNIFKRATRASLDLSKAGFGSLESAAKMLGKALNDPERGMTALGRAGVTFTRAQREQIKALVEQNKLLDAQKLILREVESQVGGSAKAYGQTFPGALAKLRNAFENVTGALAEGLAPVIRDVARDLTEKLADPRFVNRVRELGREIGEKLRGALEAIGRWFGDHWDEIKTGFRVAGKLAQGTAEAVRMIGDAFGFLLRLGLPVFKIFAAQFKFLLALISGLTNALSKLPFIGGKFSGITEAIDKIRESVRVIEEEYTSAVKGRGRKRAQEQVRSRFAGYPRAHGGPVMPGVAYRVGERGEETFVPSVSGSIIPNSGEGGNLIINLDGKEIARVALGHLQRMAKNGTSQTRGRYGGQKLAVL